jgi:hypothetical protein
LASFKHSRFQKEREIRLILHRSTLIVDTTEFGRWFNQTLYTHGLAQKNCEDSG